MTDPQPIELSPAAAAKWIQDRLAQAETSLGGNDVEGALDAYVQTLSLALQLGPAATEQVLSAILDGAAGLVRHQDADGLSAMGPALVGLTGQMREAKALPQSTVMRAWASIVDGIGALISQLGLALTLALPPERRGDMLDNVRAHAALLDDATSNVFGLTSWIEGIANSPA